ncbi:MAG TPA: phosphoglycerate kinase [Methanocella sp.]|nr:phosphoglycerate kinase [Methanocella sp.]
MTIRTINDLDVTSKRALVRVDFNVPMDKGGAIRDDTRIRVCLPTIQYLIDHRARVILCSHLGRPKGKVDEAQRLTPVAKRLSELLNRPVKALKECIGPDVKKEIASMRDGDVMLLENLRFYPGEEKNDPAFAKDLARLADIYVNDAFSASHRAHASVVGVTEYLPSVAGFLMEKELDSLGGLLEEPSHPFAAVIGGAKVSDKLEVLDNIVKRVNMFIIGGGMTATFFKSKGLGVGKSMVEEDKLQYVRNLSEKARLMGVRLLLPTDVVITENLDGSSPVRTVTTGDIPDGWSIADIGPQTVENYTRALKECRTVFWNGPMGVFEVPKFASGTKEIANAISNLKVVKVVGGGSTVEAVTKIGVADKMTHVSTGGGATLEFLSGIQLPGVQALIENHLKAPVAL